jgi:hypothetical protein
MLVMQVRVSVQHCVVAAADVHFSDLGRHVTHSWLPLKARVA